MLHKFIRNIIMKKKPKILKVVQKSNLKRILRPKHKNDQLKEKSKILIKKNNLKRDLKLEYKNI